MNVVIRTFLIRVDAELAASALEAAGIPAEIRADDCGGMEQALWSGSGVRLVVPEEDTANALAILDTPAAVTDDT